MPISGPSSFLPTSDAFVSHWEEVNSALGAGHELLVLDGMSRNDLITLRDELEGLRDNVTEGGVTRSLAREAVTVLITTLQARLVEFNERVRADLPGSTFARVLPEAFSVGDAEGTAREALRQMRALWERINGISPAPAGVTLPMVLRGGYALATLEAAIDTLRTNFLDLSDADQLLRLGRESRNDKQDVIYPILKAYRARVASRFGPDHALTESLPALTPEGGHTPDAVLAHGAWDAAAGQAKITWPASTDADLDHYELRGVPGPDYVGDDESVIATVEKDAAREVFTDFALGTPGAMAGFKVFVVLTSGNEKGSNPVYVTRPV